MRSAPKKVPPISRNGIRYAVQRFEEERFGQSGGIIQAINEKTDEELWSSKIYQIVYDPDMEMDVQEIFIKEMTLSAEDDALLITDERQRRYRVALADGAVQALE